VSAPLRVLHLRNSDRLSGPERLLLDQAALAGDGVTPLLASFGEAGAPHPFLDAARAAGLVAHLIEQKGSYDRRLRQRVHALVEETAPDIVVSHDYKANFLSIRAIRGRPRASIVHGYTGEGRKVGFFEAVDRKLLRRMDAVVVVSDTLRDQLLQAGVQPPRLHVIANGIRADRVRAAAASARADVRAELGLASEDLALLALGRLSPEKGQDVLLEAFGRLTDAEHVHLLLAGDGAARTALERRAAAPALGGRVHLLGWVDEPWRLLGAADGFVLPSRSEGLPLALLEALAAGLPVVATRVGAVAEVLEDGRCGLLVKPGDPRALTEALQAFVTDPSLRARLAGAGRARIAGAYDVAQQTRALENLYRMVAAT
jgi:glycosyltransferase involved in cell wall biosynthesis